MFSTLHFYSGSPSFLLTESRSRSIPLLYVPKINNVLLKDYRFINAKESLTGFWTANMGKAPGRLCLGTSPISGWIGCYNVCLLIIDIPSAARVSLERVRKRRKLFGQLVIAWRLGTLLGDDRAQDHDTGFLDFHQTIRLGS
jgi:hypothetical protein